MNIQKRKEIIYWQINGADGHWRLVHGAGPLSMVTTQLLSSREEAEDELARIKEDSQSQWGDDVIVVLEEIK